MDKFLARVQSRRNERNDSKQPSPERRRSGWMKRVRSTVCIPSPSSALPDGPTRPAAAPTAPPPRSNIPPSMTSSNLRPDQFRRPIPLQRPAQLRRPVQLRPLASARPLATSTRPLATSTRPLPPWARPLIPRPPKHKTTLLRLITNPPPPTFIPPRNPIFIDPRVAYNPPRTPYDLYLLHLLGRAPDPRPEILHSPSIHYLSPRSTVYFTYLASFLSLPPDLPAPVIVYCLLTRWPAVRRRLAAACPWMAAYELGVDWTGVERDPWTEVVSGGSGMWKALGGWVARREVLFPGPDPAVRRRSVPAWTMKRARVVRDWERRRRGPGWTARVWGRSKLSGEVWVAEH